MKEVREKLSDAKDKTEQRKLQERWSDFPNDPAPNGLVPLERKGRANKAPRPPLIHPRPRRARPAGTEGREG